MNAREEIQVKSKERSCSGEKSCKCKKTSIQVMERYVSQLTGVDMQDLLL